ncbi:MAG: FAD-dependent oxidoreductase [Chloroflexota bacterium]
MADGGKSGRLAAVIGAGPAGMYAARMLAANGVQVALLNRDIKPGGLAEYGIYYDKLKMKEGLRKQFRQILAVPEIHYFGNVSVGQQGDLKLADLQAMGFQAVLVAAGAQGTKWLGLPGENLAGVYHAKDIVYHYNKLPPYSTRQYRVRGRVAVVGVGNVSMDISHWAIRDLKVDEVIAVARRGPAEVKFTKKEMEYIIANLDVAALDEELARCAPLMVEVGQNVQAAREYILAALHKAEPPVSGTRLRFDFLASPTAILGNENGEVTGLEVEDTRLVMSGSDTKAVSLGTRRVLEVDSVVFCIGDKVDDAFGLPVQWNAFVKNPHPTYPIDGHSYEAYDPQLAKPIEGVFVAGWSREASSGLVGIARKDGENGAQAVLQYLPSQPPATDPQAVMARLQQALAGRRVICKDDVARLEAAEQAEARRLGLEDYKIASNEEMLAVIDG